MILSRDRSAASCVTEGYYYDITYFGSVITAFPMICRFLVNILMIWRISNMMIKKQVIIILGAIVFLMADAGCGGGKKERFLYLEKTRGLGEIILRQAEANINIARMYDTVWEYAKVTDLDFDSAYSEMMLDTSEILRGMQENREMMGGLIHKLGEPPKGCENVDETLQILFKRYLKFYRFMKKKPEVSQQEYAQKINAHLEKLQLLKDDFDSALSEADVFRK